MHDRLDSSVLVLGYQRAAARFMTAGDRPRSLITRELLHRDQPERFSSPLADDVSASGIYIALFEVLNWAYTIDDRFRRDWPEGDPEYWFARFPHGEAVRGLRYARNCVHHDWSLAVALPEKHRNLPVRLSSVFWEWVQDLSAKKPDPEGRTAYRRHLAGKGAATSLHTFSVIFLQALSVLVEHGLSTGALPFEAGPGPQAA